MYSLEPSSWASSTSQIDPKTQLFTFTYSVLLFYVYSWYLSMPHRKDLCPKAGIKALCSLVFKHLPTYMALVMEKDNGGLASPNLDGAGSWSTGSSPIAQTRGSYWGSVLGTVGWARPPSLSSRRDDPGVSNLGILSQLPSKAVGIKRSYWLKKFTGLQWRLMEKAQGRVLPGHAASPPGDLGQNFALSLLYIQIQWRLPQCQGASVSCGNPGPEALRKHIAFVQTSDPLGAHSSWEMSILAHSHRPWQLQILRA